MAKYLQLEFKTGNFYEYSGTAKDGFKESPNGNGFRRYTNKPKGELLSAIIYEGKFGEQLSFTLKDEQGDFMYVPVELYNNKGQLSTYVESLIRFLPLLEKGQQVEFNGYNFKPEDSKRSVIGFSLSINGEKVEPALTYTKTKDGKVIEKGDIPPLEWKEDTLGKVKPSAVSVEAKEDYLKSVLAEALEKLKKDEQPAAEEPKKEAPKATKQAEKSAVVETADGIQDEYDDLPF